MNFEIVSDIIDVEIIAIGNSIRDISRLRKRYGPGRWRKLKGFTTVKLANGNIWRVEVHWYEATGIGRKRMKIKRLINKI
jgi:hypothetical protein